MQLTSLHCLFSVAPTRKWQSFVLQPFRYSFCSLHPFITGLISNYPNSKQRSMTWNVIPFSLFRCCLTYQFRSNWLSPMFLIARRKKRFGELSLHYCKYISVPLLQNVFPIVLISFCNKGQCTICLSHCLAVPAWEFQWFINPSLPDQ